MEPPLKSALSEDGHLKQPTERARLGFNVYILVAFAAIGGALFGYDSGVVSSAMIYIPDNGGMKPMDNIWKELIVSMTPALAFVGSIVAGPTGDRFGRKRLIQAAGIIFSVGGLISACAPEKFTLLGGRILIGFAIGIATSIVPVYIGESTPSHVRGRMVAFFQLNITIGVLLASILAGAFSYIDATRIGWRLMVGCAMIPSVIQLVAFFFLPESPRWLFANGRTEEAEGVLHRIYDGNAEWIRYQMRELYLSNMEEKKAKEAAQGKLVLTRIFATPHVRKAFLIGCAIQAFQQLSGLNTVLFYTGTIIRSAGIQNNHATIWMSAAIASVNFFVAFIPLMLIERMGRRSLLLLSVGGVFISMALLGGSFLLINKDSYKTTDEYSLVFNVTNANYWNPKCTDHSNCDFCVTDEHCGFCQLPNDLSHGSDGQPIGFCLPFNSNDDTVSSVAPCNTTQLEGGYEWMTNYCKSKYTIYPIIIMVFYFSLFTLGFGVCSWCINAEIFPLWSRSTACSFTTSTNWLFNLLISLTFLSLSEAVTKFGAFFLYAAIILVAFIFFFITISETKGISIEEVELLFMSKEQRLKHRSAMMNNAVK